MTTIDGHTFDETLLTGSWVIDAGCRGLSFSKKLYLDPLGCHVYSMDIEDFSNEHDIAYCDIFKQAALTNYTGQTECYLFGNGTGNFIKGINGVPGNTEDRPVQTITVPTITL